MMLADYIKVLQNKKSKQILSLYSSTVLQTVLGFVTSIILTRSLNPEQFGHYSYILNLITLVSLIVTTGHISTVAMLLAQTENEENRRSLLGTSLLINLLISAAFILIIFIFSFFQDILFPDKLGKHLRALSLFLFLYPVQSYLENVFMGLNHIGALSLFRLLPKILYIVSLLLYLKYLELSFFSAVLLLLFASYLVYGFQIVRLRPRFSRIKSNFQIIESENMRYGFHIYLGSLASVATSYLCALSVSYFASNRELGFFNLALSLSGPLMLLPGVIATTMFKHFANADEIPPKLIQYTVFVSLASYAGFFLLLKPLFFLIYPAQYGAAIPLAYVMGLGMIIHGMGDVYNRFLLAKAQGKEVRNGAFITGAVNVAAFLTIVPLLASTGAALARVLVGIVYFASMFYYYQNRRSILPNSNPLI